MIILETERLRLEPLEPAHLDGLHAMSSDPDVMRYVGGVTDRDGTVAMIARQQDFWKTRGVGWWSFIERTTGELVGAGCIQHLARDLTQPLEIGWRLRPERWHQGLASEAARAMAAFAFDKRQAPILLSVAIPENTASRRVMERLGMRYRGLEHWYDRKVAVYEMTAGEWAARE